MKILVSVITPTYNKSNALYSEIVSLYILHKATIMPF